MSEAVKVNDRFEIPPGRLISGKYTVYEVVDSLAYLRCDKDGVAVSEHVSELCSGGPWNWKRLPSSQPERVEPRVGQTWKCDGRWTYELGGRTEEGKWYSETHGPDAFLADFPGPRWTLISTGEAEKPAEGIVSPCNVMAGNSLHCSTCGRHRLLHDQKADRYNGTAKGDRLTAALMQAHNDAFHEKQKAAILANYIEQQKAPYQPHWQRSGAVSTYSRRVPR